MERYEISFSGQVQGVGFRATTRRIARGFEVGGWVRNEPDGTVRCVVEGQPEAIDRFVAAIQDAMGPNIGGTDIRKSAADGEFTSFSIRY